MQLQKRYFLLILLFLTLSSQLAAAPRVYKIGVSAPLSGPVQDYGKWVQEGIAAAQPELKNTIQFVMEDDQCQPKQAVTAAKKLLEIDRVDGLLVLCGTVSGAVAPISKNSLVMTPSFRTKSLIAGNFIHYFSLQPEIDTEMSVLATQLKKQNIKSMALIAEDDEFNGNYLDSLARQAVDKGIIILRQEKVLISEVDFKAILTQYKALKPEAIFLALKPPQAQAFLKQAAEQNISAKYFANWTFGNTVKILNPPPKQAVTYTSVYKPNQGHETLNMMQANAYDIMKIYDYLFQQCPAAEQKCMLEKLNSLRNFEGASGKFDIQGFSVNKEIFVREYAGNA